MMSMLIISILSTFCAQIHGSANLRAHRQLDITSPLPCPDGADNFYRVDEDSCSELCLGRDAVSGLCHKMWGHTVQKMVVQKGNLLQGNCQEQGFTLYDREMKQSAGPCGELTLQVFRDLIA